MIVVSDTSPLINLATIGLLELIPALFHQIVIPPAVFHEIVVQGAGMPGSEEVQHASWVEVRACSDMELLELIPAVRPLMEQLQAEADFFIHKDLFSEVLRLAGES